jgi:hypothetical protein
MQGYTCGGVAQEYTGTGVEQACTGAEEIELYIVTGVV